MLKEAVFLSDIHLSEKEEGKTELFFSFLQQIGAQASSLFILGDLFDAWIGDDSLVFPFNAEVAARLRALPCDVAVQGGNRDFLIGDKFAEAAGVKLLADPILLPVCGKPTLLTHGDAFCTRDPEYNAFRAQVRNRDWQSSFLALPLEKRTGIASGLREQSESSKSGKPLDLMDVDPAEVEKALRDFSCQRIVHGHVHRPGIHQHEVDGRSCERWVLGDWSDDAGSYLVVSEEKTELLVYLK